MRTAILQRVTPELAQVATGLTAVEVQSMVTEAERLGMLGRRANRRSTEQRYHPLVREFLEDRLGREVGPAGVRDLHTTVARWAEPSDWRTAAHHYAASEHWPDLQRVLEAHLQTIVASGAFSAAADYVRQFPELPSSAAIEVVLSRESSIEGDTDKVDLHARKAMELEPTNDVVAGNFMAAQFTSGNLQVATSIARDLAGTTASPMMRTVAEATAMVIASSLDGDLVEPARFLEEFAERCRAENLPHFEGVSWLNASMILRARGDLHGSHTFASRAVDALGSSSSGAELTSAIMAKATAMGLMGDLQGARGVLSAAGPTLRHSARVEFLIESADLECLVGDVREAVRLLNEVDDSVPTATQAVRELAEAAISARQGRIGEAQDRLREASLDLPNVEVAHKSRLLATKAVVWTLAGDRDAVEASQTAIAHAESQHAGLWRELGALALAGSSGWLSGAILAVPESLQCVISFAAELVTRHLDQLDEASRERVRAEGRLRPQRWLPGLRVQLSDPARPARTAAARMLDDIGELEDVPLLRAIAKDRGLVGRDRDLGRGLARRLSSRIVVNDLGRVSIHLGNDVVPGSTIRRKVLGLLCFLVTRPRFAATREEVMEAMWPDMDPAGAVNSLNQSVYFLRRVCEPEYSEETTAGYVHQDSDLLWLDTELIESQSARCASLISQWERSRSSSVARDLSIAYIGKFALDFSYEDWSVDYRDWLHVAYLRAVEAQIKRDVDEGNFDDGVTITRRALEVDPRNEDLELSLFRLLRNSGAHSAAAEQFERYASVLRGDLGVEPPNLDSV